MVRRLGLGKNNHLTYASLVLNPRIILGKTGLSKHQPQYYAAFDHSLDRLPLLQQFSFLPIY